MAPLAAFSACLLLLPLTPVAEVISDLADVVVTSQTDERLGLEAKAEEFWRGVLGAAEGMKLAEHLELYARVEKVLAELPPENDNVRKTLAESLALLRRADDRVLSQGMASSGVAAERLAAPAGEQAWSFFSAGQNFLNLALKRFVAGGQFPERLAEHVRQRQGDILPLLKGAADSGGSVLSDTRLASKLAFDALKSDIYTKGAPKTPQAAKDVAYALVDAAAETRRRYLAFITQSAEAIARDASGQRESASAVTARARIAAMQAKWGEGGGVTEQVVNL